MGEYLPYIATVLCSIISGCVSYFLAIKKAKDDMRILEKQHKNDMDRLELEFKHQQQLKQQDLVNSVGNSMVGAIMNNSEVQKIISQNAKKNQRRR